MARPPALRIKILAVLDEHGDLHASAIAEKLGVNVRGVHSTLHYARKANLVHISGWKRSFVTRGRWGAIFALGEGKDCKPPREDTKKQADKRYREKFGEVNRLRNAKRQGKQPHPWLVLLGAA